MYNLRAGCIGSNQKLNTEENTSVGG